MRRALCVAVCLTLLAGCASQPRKADAPTTPSGAAETKRDVNLVRDGIPEVLKSALADAYARPLASGCEGLVTEIAALNVYLSIDLDSPEARDKDSDVVSRLMTDAVQSLIPYRSILRKLSGIDRREREALAAIAAGGVRRAYLKGLGEAQGCPVPAAPLRDRPDPARAPVEAG